MLRFGILCLVGAFALVLPAVHAGGKDDCGPTKVELCHMTGATTTVEKVLCEKCPKGTHPVEECEIPKYVVIDVSENAVDAHLNHGDHFAIGGKCLIKKICKCKCVDDDKEEEEPRK